MHFTSITSLLALAASLAAASPIVPPPDCMTTMGNTRRTEPNPHCPPKPPCQPIATDSNGKRHYPTDCTPPWNGTHPHHPHHGGGGNHHRPWPDKPDEHPNTNTAVKEKRHGPKPGEKHHWPGHHGHGHGNNGTNPGEPCDDDDKQGQGHGKGKGKGKGHGPKPEEQPSQTQPEQEQPTETQTQPEKRTYPDHHGGDHEHDRDHQPHKPGEQPHWPPPPGGYPHGHGHGHGHGNGTKPEEPCETGSVPGGAYPTEGAVPRRRRN